MIDVNITLLVQWVIFILVMIFLNQFLFKPVLRIIDARIEKVEGTMASAAEIKERAKQHQETYESRLTQAREKMAAESAMVREKALQKAREQMDRARNEALQMVEEVSQRLETEYRKVKIEMVSEIDQIARLISGKILERDIS